jgi:hypothetical protein
MSAALSRRLGEAVGTHVVHPDERELIFNAALVADTWEDLPVKVQRLVAEIEARPDELGGR